MPSLNKRKIYWKTWNGLEINTVDGSGCYEHMLEIAYKMMHYVMFKRARVLAIRIDLKAGGSTDLIQSYFDNNKILSSFLENYRKKYIKSGIKNKKRKEKEKKKRKHFFKCIWAREKSKEKNAHYHLVLFVDGSQHKKAYVIQQHVRKAWEKHMEIKTNGNLAGLVDYCKHKTLEYPNPTCKYMLLREDGEGEKFRECFYRLSYLAKENQKRNIDFGRNNRFHGSQVSKEFEIDRTMKSYTPQTKTKSIFDSGQ